MVRNGDEDPLKLVLEPKVMTKKGKIVSHRFGPGNWHVSAVDVG